MDPFNKKNSSSKDCFLFNYAALREHCGYPLTSDRAAAVKKDDSYMSATGISVDHESDHESDVSSGAEEVIASLAGLTFKCKTKKLAHPKKRKKADNQSNQKKLPFPVLNLQERDQSQKSVVYQYHSACVVAQKENPAKGITFLKKEPSDRHKQSESKPYALFANLQENILMSNSQSTQLDLGQRGHKKK